MPNSPINSASESLPTSGLQLQSLLTSSGDLALTLEPTDIRPPGANEVVVRVGAAPVNPSDLGLLLGAADVSTAKTVGEGPARRTTINVPPAGFRAMAARCGIWPPPALLPSWEPAGMWLGRRTTGFSILHEGRITNLSSNCFVFPPRVERSRAWG